MNENKSDKSDSTPDDTAEEEFKKSVGKSFNIEAFKRLLHQEAYEVSVENMNKIKDLMYMELEAVTKRLLNTEKS